MAHDALFDSEKSGARMNVADPFILTGELPGTLTGAAPEISCYLPDVAGKTGVGVVILPGGGYGMLAEHEGRGYAEFFQRHGVAGFVVQYRLGSAGHRHPAMLEDALAAMRTVRAQAGALGVRPDAIGIMGSSAGGHLAAHALTAWASVASDISLRPDFGILCYPVITMSGPHSHVGSRNNLLGPDATPALIDSVSCERLVSATTPPCFLWHTVADEGVAVENSMMFAAALRRHQVSFELHLYAQGRHGLGLDTDFGWDATCLRWLLQTTAASA